MKSIVAVLLFLCFSCALWSQEIVFQPQFGGEALQLGKYYPIGSGDSIQLTVLRFYVSEIEFLNQGQTVWKESGSYHLIDLENTANLRIQHAVSVPYDQVRFNLGIDSLTNVSGAMAGDLDPVLGMYWTWQSGYINFKLEGKSNLCKTRDQQFQFHLGGYLAPNDALQQVVLDVANDPVIALELERWIGFDDLANLNHVMSPGINAVQLARDMARNFRVE